MIVREGVGWTIRADIRRYLTANQSVRSLECMGKTRLEPATSFVRDLGGEIRMGSRIDAATMPAITWRPLVYDPLLCRMCAISNGPNALAEPHAVSISP